MIKRALLARLKRHLSQKEISLIIGPRQSGKTTLMLLLKEYLEKTGQKTVFLNLDIEADNQFLTTQAKLIQKIQLEIGRQKGFVFIDEIQRKENAGLFLKGIYDMNLPYKFIVSGSGSLELKEKIHESLVGRKRIFKLSTLNFEEFVNFKTNYQYEKKLQDFFNLEKEKTGNLLEEYLNFGGYPRVVLAQTTQEKRATLEEIFQSYLEKDISYLLKVKKTEVFSQLTRLSSSQIGNLVNFSEISSTLGLSAKTVKNYLWYLEKTFILEKVAPFFRNIRKEISKSPIYYFCDLGLRNYSLGTPINGFLFQNFVFNILKEKIGSGPGKIYFWRTKDRAEVDFIIDTTQGSFPIETKYSHLKEAKLTRSFKSFIKKYQPKKAFVVNLGLKTTFPFKKTKIHFILFYELLQTPLPPLFSSGNTPF